MIEDGLGEPAERRGIVTEEKAKAVELTDEEKIEAAGSICPSCLKPVENHRCRLCGARKTINQVSGFVIWMRNGRVVPGGAFKDDKTAFVRMAERCGIAEDQWPEKYRSKA